MATLINGNGNPRIYAAQDADLIAALAGDITGIAQIGNKFAATAVDANTISVADGVIVTKEGRRIQLDAGSTDMFVIPTGTTGVTNYYIIGYKLTTQSDDSQIAETFVQLMSSSSETITEDTFREGATDVYVSLYRVQQNGVNLGTITGLLPELTNISELKSDLGDIGSCVTLLEPTLVAHGNSFIVPTDKKVLYFYLMSGTATNSECKNGITIPATATYSSSPFFWVNDGTNAIQFRCHTSGTGHIHSIEITIVVGTAYLYILATE